MRENDQLSIEIQRNVSQALAEDVGTGDLTARLIPPGRAAQGLVTAREEAVLCGHEWFEACLRALDPKASVAWHVAEGEWVAPDQMLCEILAETRALLTAERAALNFVQLLSATATITRRFVDAISGTEARIVDTRKTLPGLRLAQKYAVTIGGGLNHRMGLYDGILIKENHIMAAGGIRPVLARARGIAPSNAFIQIEVETLAQLHESLDAGATMVLLDNMSIDQMREAVQINAGRAELEASGGVSLDRVRAIAETGVHRISIGVLTKNVRAIDLSLRHVER
ncbi:MAG: carboxylating nicotinate-nucleotide diphosphorylase [Gammaproteobacteria bacterium]|jgi:nicotinate-nucleotide pyrophosphorylase (carboxylating)|nr:carboxylating nicotinate-nucleotide diphosphorylase [Gammaproteobacteria bacterium]MBU0856115.1 carboxylating nicotinate-nucleotide diphosphorylase [Gammaproteobacteria bacterium]MBU1846182.1 carboxylating nicotinate-nucleotide diphosphorylase [Gammaproteobacteria bacterium]